MKRSIVLLILVIPVFYCCSQKNRDITQRLDHIVEKYVDRSEYMGSVLIARNGEVLLKKGYGFADIENKIANTPETNFYLASVSKLFTVAAIIDLKNKGLLKLEDTLTKYIPDYPNGNKITVRQLIEHKSGIVDFVNDLPYELIKYEIKLTNLIDTFKYQPLTFEPGERYSYCTSGYSLLAFIIEKVSGASYSDYIEKNIFSPLGMTNSFSDWNKIPKTEAKGYHKVDRKFVQSDYFHPSQFLGSGNLTSTVGDLYKWYEAIYKTGKISLEYQTDHIGRIEGWTSTNFYPIIASDYVIILLSNYGEAPVVEIAKEIREELFKDGDTHQPLPASSFKKYTGYFKAGDKFYFKIEKGDNCLICSANDNNNHESCDTLYKVAENEFKRPNMRVTFSEEDKGAFNRIFVFWGTEGYMYNRTD